MPEMHSKNELQSLNLIETFRLLCFFRDIWKFLMKHVFNHLGSDESSHMSKSDHKNSSYGGKVYFSSRVTRPMSRPWSPRLRIQNSGPYYRYLDTNGA
jgi:hypothetical protein